jgi:polyphosphate kinase 2 (PPK2 family)
VFNRSYYEEVLIVRVHPELLEAQLLPGDTHGKDFWKARFQSIRELLPTTSSSSAGWLASSARRPRTVLL